MYKFILLIGFICFLSFPSPCFAWWRYEIEQDKMTDEIKSVMAWTSNRRSRVILAVVCSKPRPSSKHLSLTVRYLWYSAKYHWGREMAKRDGYFETRVVYRTDKNPPVETYWYLNDREGHSPLIYTYVSPMDSLLVDLAKGQNVTFRVADPTGESQDVTFSLSGSGKQIHKVVNACKQSSTKKN